MYIPPGQSNENKEVSPNDRKNEDNTPRINFQSQERTHNTMKVENVSLMVMPALVSNGKKELKINVMLNPCSTNSYVTEKAAEELGLRGESINLIIAGTGGIKIQKRSRRVELNVTSLEKLLAAPVQAHVLDNIASDTSAIPWAEFIENVSRRQQIDVMLDSDHPVFHHVLKEVHGSQPSDPVARQTNLGRVCFAPTLVNEFRRNSHSHFTRTYRTCHINKQPPPDDILRKFWELEALGKKENTEEQPMTVDERAATATVAVSLKHCCDSKVKRNINPSERKIPTSLKPTVKYSETMRRKATFRE